MYHQLPPPVDSILDWHIAMAFLVDARLRTRKNTFVKHTGKVGFDDFIKGTVATFYTTFSR